MTVDDFEVGMRVLYRVAPFDDGLGYDNFDGKEGVVEFIIKTSKYPINVKFDDQPDTEPYCCHLKELTILDDQIDEEDLWE